MGLISRLAYKLYSFCHCHELRFGSVYLPIFSDSRAERSDASKKRLSVIREEIGKLGLKKNYSVMDLGCNNGYFLMNLVKDGVFCIGVEAYPDYIGQGRFIIEREKIKSIGLVEMLVSPDNIEGFPDTDISVFLSVFQKIAKQNSFDEASRILQALWQKTKVAMFFEMPDSIETVEVFRDSLPDMGKTKEACNIYIENYMKNLLRPSQIQALGEFDMDYRQEKRTLFLLKK